MRTRLLYLILCFLFLAPLGLFAQTQDPLDEIRRLEAIERRTNELGSFQEKSGAPDPGPAQARGGPCFPISQIRIEGVTIFPAAQLAAIAARYVPNCMQGADIQAVMRELDALYADAGYITSKTYVPAQNLQSGTLVLAVLEGRLEGLYLIDAEKQIEGRRAKWLLDSAFPMAMTGLFQLRDFEQGLDQMNRLTSVDAVLQLQPGQTPGGSYAIIQRLQADRVRGFARLDNMGAASTGRQKLALDLEVDDLIGVNDSWNLGYSGSLNTNALSLGATVPYGYWTVSGDLSYSEYLTPLSAASELFGRTSSGGLRATWLFKRDQRSTSELIFALNKQNSERFVNAVALTPQKLTTLSFGWRHMQISAQARNSFDASLTLGTPWLGATLDAADPVLGAPEAQFVKLSGGWQRQGALGKLGTLVTDWRVQYSPDPLYGSEQLSLGSYASVRGFTESVAAGDSGYIVRNDLYLSADLWAPALPQAMRATAAQRFQPHLFLDYGVVYDNARQIAETAAGAGLGFSWYTDRLTIAGLIGAPLFSTNDTPDGVVLQLRADLKTW